MLFVAGADRATAAMANAAEFMVQSAVQRYLSDLVVVDALEVTRDEGEL